MKLENILKSKKVHKTLMVLLLTLTVFTISMSSVSAADIHVDNSTGVKKCFYYYC
ncbi:hypothetical protein MBFIL_19210 [Methanobrevibacter filiformis]|uniref:Uncharacterized protein n=1 Tax=Methanobrevibacter filiformis TaxID=55758 RepID=A0A165YZ02_9EURY|nr:hypothetical protein MBFIL_19210 [Methanobrevibacter filiformis]